MMRSSITVACCVVAGTVLGFFAGGVLGILGVKDSGAGVAGGGDGVDALLTFVLLSACVGAMAGAHIGFRVGVAATLAPYDGE